MARTKIALSKLGEWRNQDPTLYQIIQEVQQKINAYILAEGGEVDAQIAAALAGEVTVKSVNALTGAVVLAAGANVTLTVLGNTITIASSGGGGASAVGSDLYLYYNLGGF